MRANLTIVPVSSEHEPASAPEQPTHQTSGVALPTAGAAVAANESVSAVRTARIERLRSAVETGTYKVDLEALASRIVDDEERTRSSASTTSSIRRTSTS